MIWNDQERSLVNSQSPESSLDLLAQMLPQGRKDMQKYDQAFMPSQLCEKNGRIGET
jgi:hypothetical protein